MLDVNLGHRVQKFKSEPADDKMPYEVQFEQYCGRSITVRQATIADLRATNAFGSALLQAKAEQGAPARAQRRRFVAIIAFMLSPVWATHFLPALVEFAPLLAPLLAIAVFLVSTAAGVGEQHEDVRVDANFAAKGMGSLKGYAVPLPPRLLAIYGKVARGMLKLPPLTRLVIVNVGLTGISLCSQFAFNYSVLLYQGVDFASVPVTEFWSRRIACVFCTAEHEVASATLVMSWCV